MRTLAAAESDGMNIGGSVCGALEAVGAAVTVGTVVTGKVGGNVAPKLSDGRGVGSASVGCGVGAGLSVGDVVGKAKSVGAMVALGS